MSKFFLKRKRIRRTFRIIKEDGFTIFIVKFLKKTENFLIKKSKSKKIDANMLAKSSDIEKAQWVTHPYKQLNIKKKPPFIINWVMSPPRGGGGHQNIYRFIKYLEDNGHKNNVYVYSNTDKTSIQEIKEGMKNIYPIINDDMQLLKNEMADADIVFATGWETAYPVFNHTGKAAKFYFVQDFEPYFYPKGTEFVLAENTYRFNFHGITAGKWLTKKLSTEYGMRCDFYDFGADTDHYTNNNNNQRKEIFFYARPVTPRRGFELGIMALEEFHKRHPEYQINLAGWDVSAYKINFPYKNLKTLIPSQLPGLYNKCAAALVISLTNMSLLPLELIACGTIPIVTEGENNRLVTDNQYIQYAYPSPDSLAASLSETIERNDLVEYSKKASQSVQNTNWDTAGKKVENILTKVINV